MSLTGSEVRSRLRRFICEELLRRPGYPLGDRESIFSGGLLDSYAIAHLGAFIESELGVYIPDPELTVEGMDTLDDVVARVLRGA